MNSMVGAEDQHPQPPFWQTYRVPLVLCGVGIVVIIISLILLIKTVQTATPIEFSHSSPAETAGSSGQALTIRVDIEGAVVSPGVYELPRDSRVEDAIAAAGGLASDADTERIAATVNRAAKLVDGGKLYFPKQGERQGQTLSTQELQAQGRALGSQLSTVSVNTASQSELEALAGVGPVTAQKIINNRPYQTLQELLAKKVLSASLYKKLKDQLTL